MFSPLCLPGIEIPNRCRLWLLLFKVVLSRQAEGYGFTLKGHSCPARVGRIKAGSCALRAGLQTGDYITKVRGHNVSRSSAHSIALLIRWVSISDIHVYFTWMKCDTVFMQIYMKCKNFKDKNYYNLNKPIYTEARTAGQPRRCMQQNKL